MSEMYVFKVFINGDFRAAIEAPHHDAAVSDVRKNWLIQESDAVEVIRLKKVS